MTSPFRSASHYRTNAATDAARMVFEPAAPWIERFARVGFAAKAVLYGIIGALALRAAIGAGGETTGRDGAFSTLVRQEWGAIALVVMAVGLFGYAAWRIAEAILDPERKGHDAKGISLRVSYAARGLFHAALGVQAIRLASGMGGSNGQNTESLTARALDAPMGSWLIVGAGLAFAGYGLYQLYRAWKAKLSRQLDLSRLSQEAGAGVRQRAEMQHMPVGHVAVLGRVLAHGRDHDPIGELQVTKLDGRKEFAAHRATFPFSEDGMQPWRSGFRTRRNLLLSAQ